MREPLFRAEFRVPIAGDFHGVGFRRHGIENRLLRQARRKRAKAARHDKREFVRTDWAIERDPVLVRRHSRFSSMFH